MNRNLTDLTGEVVRAGDAGYEAARVGWNRLHCRYLEAIVFCADTADVVDAAQWAREQGIALRARSGRHSLDGWSSVDGGVVIDVSRMKGVAIDDAAGTATVGTGLTQREVVPALGERGFVMPTGSEGGVGLGGVILCGGGGNFGIATSYTLKLHELERAEFAILRWEGHENLAEVLRIWQRDAPVADDRLTSEIEANGGAIELTAVLHGGTRAELDEALASMLAIGAPDVTNLNDAWPILFDQADRAPDLPYWKFYSQFSKEPFPDVAIDLICQFMASTPTAPSDFYRSSFGGAVRHAPPGGSAFPHRDALFYCEPGAAWDDPALHATALRWAGDFCRALRPFGDGAYANVPNAPASDWEHEYFGANAERLRQVKAVYDPRNVFSFEQSVPVEAVRT